MRTRSCPVCQSNSYKIDYSTKFEYIPGIKNPLSIEVANCNKCNFLFVPEYIDNSELMDFYSKFSNYEYKDESEWPEKDRLKSERQFKYCSSKITENSDILDFGCSLGYTLNLFKKTGHNCVGIEPSPTASRYAIENFKLDIITDFYEDNIPEIGRFDLIILSHVLEHIWRPEVLLKELKKTLKSKGKIFIEVPIVEFFSEERDPMPITVEHVNYFSINSLITLAESSGLKLSHLNVFHNLDGEAPNYTTVGFLLENSIEKLKNDYPKESKLISQKLDPSIKRIKRWKNFGLSNKKIIIWGAGNMGMQFYSNIMNICEDIIIVDSNTSKQGSIRDIHVMDPKSIDKLSDYMVVISSYDAFSAINNSLEKINLNLKSISLFKI